jgi:hypothetical protein
MIKLKHFLIILTSLIFVLTGCSTKCDDFNNKIIDWMPYKTSDKILISSNNEKDTLIVNYIEIYHTDKIGSRSLCACENSFSVNLSSDAFDIDIRFNDSKLINQSDIVINSEWMNYSEQMDSLNINGKIYKDLIVFQNSNQTSSMRFEKIIVAKSIGIIAIIGKNEEWIIVDDSKRQIETSDIKFKRTDC